MGDLLQFQLLAQETENLSTINYYDGTYKDLPAPCRTNVYKLSKSSNQTNTCAEMAARFYYNKLYPGKFLNDLEGVDSHSFDRKYHDAKDDKAYFHVNFKAKTPSRANLPSMFFAELSGKNGPQEVNMCVQLDSGEIDNCRFCTGIWHPQQGFAGYMDDDHTKKRKRFVAGTACFQDIVNSSQSPFAAPKPLPKDFTRRSRKRRSAGGHKLPHLPLPAQANPFEKQGRATYSSSKPRGHRPPCSQARPRRPRSARDV